MPTQKHTNLKGRAEEAPSRTMESMLAEIKALPYQTEWDDRLDDPEFIAVLDAHDIAGRMTVARLVNKARICMDCIQNERKHLSQPLCPAYRWVLDVRKTLETRTFAARAVPCPFMQDKIITDNRVDFLSELEISTDKIRDWDFSSLKFPRRDSENPVIREAFKELYRATTLCRKYRESPESHWLYLHSMGHGTGKTRLAIATALSFSQQGIPVHYVNFPTLYARYKGTLGVDTSEDEYADMVAHTILPSVANRKGLLVLDDVGKEITSLRTLEWLYVITDTRYMSNLPTVITSNYSLKSLEAKYGGVHMDYAEAIISRIIGKVGDPETTPLEETYIMPLDKQRDMRRLLAVKNPI